MPQFLKWEGSARSSGRAISRTIQNADATGVFRFGVAGMAAGLRAGPNDPSYGAPRPIGQAGSVAWFEWRPARPGHVMVEIRDTRNAVLDSFQLAIQKTGLGEFTLDMSSPIQAVAVTHADGPGGGGHTGPDWFIAAGMDFHAVAGTPVLAAFDGHITRFQPHQKATDSAKVFGAQIFVRGHQNGMGGFYTHITDVPKRLGIGAHVRRGEPLGVVYTNGQTGAHLHWALVEIIGGLPGGRYVGVNLHEHFKRLSGSSATTRIRFPQNGSRPGPA
jgi:murein DD-endopeptidase MepM/ murein hydrolase activator NlpD